MKSQVVRKTHAEVDWTGCRAQVSNQPQHHSGPLLHSLIKPKYLKDL